LRQLEQKLPELPCQIPEHNRAFIFMENRRRADAVNEKLRASLDACPRCKDKQKIIFMHWQQDGQPQPPKQEAPVGIHIMKIGDE